MTLDLVDIIARISRQYKRGIITDSEFVTSLTDNFAGDSQLDLTKVDQIASLIPPEIKPLVLERIGEALEPGYLRQAFSGIRRTVEQEHAAAVRETEREQEWARKLRPLL